MGDIKINDALIKIQQELKVPKGQKNQFGGYKYRSNEDILSAVKPIANKLGCSITQFDEMVLVGDRIYCKATTQLANDKGVLVCSAFAREPLAQKGMSESQMTGTASSYARKYSANGLFALDESEMDVDSMKNEPVKPKQTKIVKPELIRESNEFEKAKVYILDGGDIAKIEKKYYLTEEIKKELKN